jgi:DNA-binding transcriptional MerR regulator
VLRFWETRFSTIKPLKRGGGRRYYRPEDVLLLKGIRHLLYDQGFTIKGVQRILKEHGPRHVIAMANGAPLGSIVPLPADSEGRGDLEPAAAELMPPVRSGTSALDASDREKLAGVLRELLDCKRLLERAREG